jgi:hypothetical protein
MTDEQDRRDVVYDRGGGADQSPLPVRELGQRPA